MAVAEGQRAGIGVGIGGDPAVHRAVRRLYSVRLKKDEEVKRERVAKATVENVGGDGTAPKKQPVKKVVKIGRNDPCPCGSGLKWKKCTCKEYHPDL